jgi:acyl-CoA synthetase (NDP forming)
MDSAKIRDCLSAARARGRRALSEPEAKQVLALADIACPRGGLAGSAAEAEALARELTSPLVLKVVSPDISHKTDVGGLELDVRDPAEAREAFDRLVTRVRERRPPARVDRVMVEEMVRGGVEVVASATRHAQLGPVLMVGLGGLWVEVLGDVSFRLIPVEEDDVEEMLAELRAAALLEGARGRALDRKALTGVLLALSALMQEFEREIDEVEINPLGVLPAGVRALDAAIILREAA